MADDLGSRLRAARAERGLTLRGLAAEVGVSAAMISQIELGRTQPSVSTLYALVDFFDISLDQVMGLGRSRKPSSMTVAAASVEPALVRGEPDRPAIEMGNGVRWEIVASSTSSGADAVLVTYEPGASSSPDGRLMTHDGHEDAYLLEGELVLELEDAVQRLRAGDSFSFDSSRPHRFHNAGAGRARAIWLKGSGEL